MSLFNRTRNEKGGMYSRAVPGDNPLCGLTPITNAATGASTITAARMAGGVYVAAITSAVTHTTDTAANILAANAEMSVGDSAVLLVSNPTAYVLTVAGGTGVTASGTLTVAAGASRMFLFTKTSDTTMTVKGL